MLHRRLPITLRLCLTLALLTWRIATASEPSPLGALIPAKGATAQLERRRVLWLMSHSDPWHCGEDSVVVNLTAEGSRSFRELSPAEQKTYLEENRFSSEQALKAALAGERFTSDLAQVAQTFRHTPAGNLALNYLIAHLMDRGHRTIAEFYFRGWRKDRRELECTDAAISMAARGLILFNHDEAKAEFESLVEDIVTCGRPIPTGAGALSVEKYLERIEGTAGRDDSLLREWSELADDARETERALLRRAVTFSDARASFVSRFWRSRVRIRSLHGRIRKTTPTPVAVSFCDLYDPERAFALARKELEGRQPQRFTLLGQVYPKLYFRDAEAMLQSSDTDEFVLPLLGESLFGDERTSPLLISKMLRHPKTRLRLRVVQLLSSRPIPGADLMIAERLRDRDSLVRIAAMDGLAMLNARWAIPPIAERISDKKVEVRAAAILALSNLRAEDQIPRIAHELSSRDFSVRMAAIGFVTVMGRPAATPPILARLEHIRQHDDFLAARNAAYTALIVLRGTL